MESIDNRGRAGRLAEPALRTCPPDGTAVVRLDQRMPTGLMVSRPTGWCRPLGGCTATTTRS
ncbi:hypothetical protein [Streptomyces canus]|uniref:hypothetical protein n=1 Tax=Streptomyces canus TaxID=58343 RepID=UPI002E26893F